jgi:hypothetical protein
MHPIRGIGVLISTIAVAAVVGFGIPAAWVWIGSQVQGGRGSTSLDWSVVMLIFFGIVISYAVVLYIAGFVISVLEHDPDPQKQKSSARNPWMRGMTDTRAVKPRGADKTWAVETVFVSTTLIVSAAAIVWFFVLAGSPLPTQ